MHRLLDLKKNSFQSFVDNLVHTKGVVIMFACQNLLYQSTCTDPWFDEDFFKTTTSHFLSKSTHECPGKMKTYAYVQLHHWILLNLSLKGLWDRKKGGLGLMGYQIEKYGMRLEIKCTKWLTSFFVAANVPQKAWTKIIKGSAVEKLSCFTLQDLTKRC